jgi:hypothetical protein
MSLTGKTIGELPILNDITEDTLFPVELTGTTYHTPFSSITEYLQFPYCKININGTSGLSNTTNGVEFLVPYNNTVINTSTSVFNLTNSKIQLILPGRYLIKARYSSYDMTDGTDFLRLALITSTTPSSGDLGTKIEYLDQGFIGTTGNGEATKSGSKIYTSLGNEWIGIVCLHGGASGGVGNQGYPVFDNTFFNQPYFEVVRIGE